MSVVVVLEQRSGKWNRMSFEALETGRKIAQVSGLPVQAVVLGSGIDELAKEAAAYDLAKVSAIDDPLLANYTPEAYTAALEQEAVVNFYYCKRYKIVTSVKHN